MRHRHQGRCAFPPADVCAGTRAPVPPPATPHVMPRNPADVVGQGSVVFAPLLTFGCVFPSVEKSALTSLTRKVRSALGWSPKISGVSISGKVFT